MKNRVLFAILLPVVAVAALVAVWAAGTLVPPLVGFIQKRTDASLELVTGLGLARCETSFSYILDLRLEDDKSMIASIKRETLSEIDDLNEQFDKIQLVVLDVNGRLINNPKAGPLITTKEMKDLDIRGRIVNQAVHYQPARTAARYFPIWRWYVVGYIYEDDYSAPLNLARKLVFGGTLAVLLATLVTVALTFYLHVNRPLKRIISAAEKVAGGKFEQVGIVGMNEIGKVTNAFNSMVSSLETDQQKINEILSALRESEEMYRLVTENGMSHILLLLKGEVIFANQRALQDSGYSSKDLLGKKALPHIHPDDRSNLRRMVRQCITGHMVAKPIEARYLTKSGDLRWIELAVVPTTYQGETAILIHGSDITRRKKAFDRQQRLEAKLRQAQKLEAIGTLAGGIAHDFNNLLMGIQGNASLMQLDLSRRDPCYERADNIQQYVKNGAELTRQLLGYARGGKYEVRPSDINALLSKSSHMFGRTKKEIVIKLDLQADIWSVEVDRGQIEQVLLNIYVNAWQAMPNGGELFLSTENIVVGDMDEKMLPLQAGDYICIKISDTGVGIDADTAQKIFDPFFTTKQRERGTGLGLASAYGIIRNHGGSIICKSKPNEGAVFFIYLPRSDKSPMTESVPSVPVESGSEVILLVDDEKMVIDVGVEMLVYLGYRVLTAGSGDEALDVLKQNREVIDLIILDMVMPEMGGAETFEAIRDLDQNIPVLLCSGYSLEGQASQIMKRGCDGFIQKPFDLDLLSHNVRRILESSERAPDLALSASR